MSMKILKSAFRYGLIGGLIMNLSWWLSYTFFKEEMESFNFENGELLGYLIMILAMSTVFIGIRNYRNAQLEGYIGFGQAFKVGLHIVLVASVVYVVGWMIYYYTMIPDFTDRYMAHEIEKIQSSGQSQETIESQIAEVKSFSDMYKNPLIMAGITFLEIFPLGLIISLLSALILKKKPK